MCVLGTVAVVVRHPGPLVLAVDALAVGALAIDTALAGFAKPGKVLSQVQFSA